VKACVVFSGGQDSTTCLAWAKKNFKEVYALNFFYEQRHVVEMKCAEKIAKILETPLQIVDLSFLGTLSNNSLSGPDSAGQKIDLTSGFNNLPSTFVVGRNALFLSVAAAWALPRGIENIVFGASQVDFSGYPDCREEFLRSQEKTLSLATDSNLKIHTPILKITKAQTFELAAELGVLELILEETHTCYKGERTTRHAWGYGCGQCPACVLRKEGFEKYGKS